MFVVSAIMKLLLSGFVAAQHLQDVLHIWNGGVIRGIIVEQVPGRSVKTQARDGGELVSADAIPGTARGVPVDGASGGAGAVEQVPMDSLWYFNPLGFLQMGPILGAEWALSDKLYLDTHWRYSTLGALYHLTVLGLSGLDMNMLSMGLGGGLKFAVAIPRSNNKGILGVLSEYGWGGVEPSDRRWTREHSYVVVAGNAAYRWRWPESGFLLNLGLIGGVAVELTDRWWHHDNPTVYENPLLTYPVWLLELSIGWEFGAQGKRGIPSSR